MCLILKDFEFLLKYLVEEKLIFVLFDIVDMGIWIVVKFEWLMIYYLIFYFECFRFSYVDMVFKVVEDVGFEVFLCIWCMDL